MNDKASVVLGFIDWEFVCKFAKILEACPNFFLGVGKMVAFEERLKQG